MSEDAPVMEQEQGTDKFLQRWHAIVGLVLSVVAIVGLWVTYASATQLQMEQIRERVSKTEYQALMSIDDRKDLHVSGNRTQDLMNQINQRLAHIEEKLDQRGK